MTGQESISTLRESYLNDTVQPYLWSDPELLRMLNYSEVQACRRAHLIIDDSTASDSGTAATASTAGQKALCTLPIIAGTAKYNLSPKILQVRRVQFASSAYSIPGPITYNEIDNIYAGWKGSSGTVGTCGTGGYPIYFLNEPGNTITFILAPYANDTAYLVVSRLPLFSFNLLNSPEIPEQYHEGLLNGAAERAYLKRDSDCYNPDLSKYYGDLFTKEFGPLPDAYSERMRRVLSQNQRIKAREFGS